ncbi:SLAP domain-containing protein [Companilactobacillus metriopterae]|uniref:SLAP domain-containing protein n=1 Tax=Companilactobacillus metriopterae TaxID=1909267 RepID=UPI00100C0755|nr:SLAP domain-containing protein [Companilactobacillus metriopterae]
MKRTFYLASAIVVLFSAMSSIGNEVQAATDKETTTSEVVKDDGSKVKNVDTSLVAQYDNMGKLVSKNLITINKPVYTYTIEDGEMVATKTKLDVNSSWLVGAQVTTQDGKTFYQISTNSYVLQDDNVSVVKMQTVFAPKDTK